MICLSLGSFGDHTISQLIDFIIFSHVVGTIIVVVALQTGNSTATVLLCTVLH